MDGQELYELLREERLRDIDARLIPEESMVAWPALAQADRMWLNKAANRICDRSDEEIY